jgi:MSHA biogenesis protein MshJ
VSFKERIGKLQARIDTLTLRERGILFIALAALLFVLIDGVLIGPQERQQKQLLGSISKVRSEIAKLEQQKVEIIRRHSEDPNAEELAQLARLQLAAKQAEEQIKGAIAGLIEPQEMARALQGVLKEQHQLNFIRISNLGATPLLDPSAEDSQDKPEAGIYKHTMRIELEGSFERSRDYLRTLEQLPWKFHWESVELEVIEYPRVRVVITVNTLSLSEGWIGV